MDDIVLGAKQFPNPKNIKPKLDTEPPDLEDNIVVPMNMNLAKPYGPKPHPLDNYYKRQPKMRHQLGGKVPKISEN